MIVEHPEHHIERFRGMKAIGYWRPIQEDIDHHQTMAERFGRFIQKHYYHLPNPRDFIDSTWDSAERDLVMNYLDTKYISTYCYDGGSDCRICGKGTGGKCLNDSVFVWPSGFSHYLREHHVRPPQAFVDHVRDMLAIRYLCDEAGHLICTPYTTENLHVAARHLTLGPLFYKTEPYPHYAVPWMRIEDVRAKCDAVEEAAILAIVGGR